MRGSDAVQGGEERFGRFQEQELATHTMLCFMNMSLVTVFETRLDGVVAESV